MYFHETFVQDTVIWLGATGLILFVVYLLFKFNFAIQDRKAQVQNRQVEIAWAKLSMVENQRKVVLNQWYTRQIDVMERDRQLLPLDRKRAEAETEWIIEGRK